MVRASGLFLLLAVLLATPHFSNALSCFCGTSPCEKPGCCESGSYSGDVCGCCTTCAKGEGEACGGPWGVTGACALGLSCFRECGCQTVNRKKCVFPFRYKGQVYEACTKESSENGQSWCATAVDPETGDVISGFWEDCAGGCPGSDYPCGLFNLDGKCVNETFRAKVEAEKDIRLDPVSNEPNFEFRDGVKDFNNDGSVHAPKCSQLTSTIEGTGTLVGEEGKVGECRCATEGHTPGKGQCYVPPGRQSQFYHGWCFLEAIRDPQAPTKHCFKDTKWSPTAGRFWSADACKENKEEEVATLPPPPPFGGTLPPPPIPDYPVVDLNGDVIGTALPIPATPAPIHYDAVGGADEQEDDDDHKLPDTRFF